MKKFNHPHFIGRYCVNNSLFDLETIRELKKQDLFQYFPRYIIDPPQLCYGFLRHIYFTIAIKLLKLLVWIFLHPRLESAGSLDIAEVERIYSREAKTYDSKHHLTTRGMDLIWRRTCGWFISTIQDETLQILDLCTGTGLTVREISKILFQFGRTANITGLDYNVIMLELARRKYTKVQGINVKFVRGDAMALAQERKALKNSLVKFEHHYFNIVIQMFGLGGITNQIKVLEEVLKILKNGGHFFLTDIHRPISEFFGELPFLLQWIKMPVFEAVLYEKATMPLVLNRLWGWRDVTASFYLISLITYLDNENNYWGFEKKYFNYEPQRWWFALPLMPIAQVIVEKIRITEKEAKERHAILRLLEESLKSNNKQGAVMRLK